MVDLALGAMAPPAQHPMDDRGDQGPRSPRRPATRWRWRCSSAIRLRSPGDVHLVFDRGDPPRSDAQRSSSPAGSWPRTACSPTAGQLGAADRGSGSIDQVAGSPTSSGRPWSVRPTMRAGFSLITRAPRASEQAPAPPSPGRHHGQRGLHPSIPAGPPANSQHFLLLGVRGVVGGHTVDDTIGQGRRSARRRRFRRSGGLTRLTRRRRVSSRPSSSSRWWGDLGGDRDAPRLGPFEDLDGAGGGGVADVHPGAGIPGQDGVAGDDRLLGGTRPAGQAEPGGVVLRGRRRPPSAGSSACWAISTPSPTRTPVPGA